jgi:hypothetical protein
MDVLRLLSLDAYMKRALAQEDRETRSWFPLPLPAEAWDCLAKLTVL